MTARNYVKKIFITFYKALFKTYYSLMTRIKKHNNKKAVFVLSRGRELEGNLQCIYQELTKQLDGVKIHFVYTENRMDLKLFSDVAVISDAQYLILDDYYLPVYLIKPNKRLKIIQLWHAAGAFKKFGYSTIGTRFGPKDTYLELIPIHSNYTHVYVSSKNVVPFYAEAFNMSESNIYPLGIPRIDLFNNKNQITQVVSKLSMEYPVIEDRKYINILVAPTYRAGGIQRESDFNIVDIISNMMKYISDDVRIFFKAHPYMPKKEMAVLEDQPNVIIISKYSINEWMLIADAFITDYSSSIFDFSLLERPFAHFVPDIDDYKMNRGFYQDIEKISDGTVITDQESLVNWINSREQDEHFDTSRMVHHNFDNTKDVSKKIVTHFIYS